MKYRISVKEINYGCIEVEAASEAEAYEKAEAKYAMSMTVWEQGEYELTNAQPIRESRREEVR